MNEAAEQALSNFQHEQALSIAHAKRAEGYLAQFLKTVDLKDNGPGFPTGSTVRCVREWTRWLAENGPATRTTITEATGVKFTERGTPHTFMWDDDMVTYPDDALPANAIMRMRGPANQGRGAPPVIFFLWSQRWDVHPLFGVGPIKGSQSNEDQPSLFDLISGEMELRSISLDNQPGPGHGTVLGVVQPPVSSHPIDPAYGEEVPLDWGDEDLTEGGPVRYDSMEEWDQANAALFDALVSAEAKPTDEQKQVLFDTLPEGADGNAAIAIAHREAVLRARGNG